MAQRIFPSENDVHDVSGGGRKPTEENLTLLRNTAAAQISHFRNSLGPESVGPGGVLTGFDFSSGDATSVILTAGTATIKGFAVEDTLTISGTLTANMFNYVFLTLDETSSLVTGLSLTVIAVAAFGSAMTIPADSILLFCFETDGASIITQFDFRTVGSNVLTGSYTGDGAATRTFDIGFRPKMVHVYRNEDNRFCAQSPLAVPRESIFSQKGVFQGQTQHTNAILSQSPVSVQLTDDPELVPIIVENGFTVEDGPGGFSEGGVWLTGNKTFDPPFGTGFTTTVTVPGVISAGSLVRAHHSSLLPPDWELQVGSGETKVIAVDTVQVVFSKVLGGAVDPGIDTLTVHVFEVAKSDLWRLNELNKFYFFIAWY